MLLCVFTACVNIAINTPTLPYTEPPQTSGEAVDTPSTRDQTETSAESSEAPVETTETPTLTTAQTDTPTETAETTETAEPTETPTLIPCKHIPVTDEGKAPTCTEKGLTEGSHCEVCGEVLTPQEVIPATGHKPVVDKAVEATCAKVGKTEGSHCSVCGAVLVEQKTIAKTSHTVVTDPACDPTCTEKGKTEGSHCSVCGKTIVEQKTIAPLRHNYVDDVCTRCGATYIPSHQLGSSYMLHETADAGQDYQDSIIFLGDSTTAHLIYRGGLPGGSDTTQVWRGSVGNTITFAYIETVKIIYPQTGEAISIFEAARRAQPKYMVITLGVTGAVSNNLKEASFKKLYKWLIDSILEVSPDTVIIVQSIYPVKKAIHDHYPTVTNAKIIRYNGYIEEVVKEEYDEGKNVYYLYTYDYLLDDKGNMREEFGTSDCLHITEAGYAYILELIRTHAVTLQ